MKRLIDPSRELSRLATKSPSPLEPLEPRLLFTAVPLITEFVASNDTGLQDEDGETSDWIELFNDGDTALNLNGWHLTDDSGDLDQWAFPSVTLDPGAFLVVFASSKDRAVAGSELHTNFKLGAGGEYLALVEPDGTTVAHAYTPQYPAQQADTSYGLAMSTSSQTLVDEGTAMRYLVPANGTLGTTWIQNGFNDVAWSGGVGTTAGIGYENNINAPTSFSPFIDTAVASGTTSVYTRFDFNVADPAGITALTLRMTYDDGFVAYLNGVQVADDFAPGTPLWNSAATGDRGDNAVLDAPTVFDLAAHLDQLIAGNNVLAIHALNRSAGSSDMLMIPELIAETALVDHPASTGFLAIPTPGLSNGPTFLGFVDDTELDVDRGFFTSAFDVTITTATVGADIYYTTDGSAPSTTNGTLYTGPVNISTTTVLRAVATMPGFASSNVNTQTYLFVADVVGQPNNPAGFPPDWGTHANFNAGNSPFLAVADYEMDPQVVSAEGPGTIRDALLSLPTLSLVMDRDDLFDATTGFYSNSLEHGINWERGVSVEFIDPDSTAGFQVDAGVRAHGGASRRPWKSPKHSMRLYFRDDYGPSRLEFPIFGDAGLDSFDRLVLRGGFNDAWQVDASSQRFQAQYINDQFVRDSSAAMGNVAAAGRYVHLYLNGLYWGVYNVAERMDSEFHADHFGGDADDYDVISHGGVVDGNDTAWDTLLDFVNNNDMSNAANYQTAAGMLDVASLIDYMLVNFYSGTLDWPGNNWLAAGNRVTGEGFRFFVWDAEMSLNSVNENRTGVNNSGSPADIYDRLRASDEFNQLFADRVQQHLFNDGALTTANATARYQALANTIRESLYAESARWGDVRDASPLTVDGEWQTEFDRLMSSYFPARHSIVLSQLRSAGLFPSASTDAPSFSQHGGVLPAGQVSINNTESSGVIYYTLDGSDPRLVGGAISTSAILYTGTLNLADHTTVTARLLRNGNWSAKLKADFVLADVPADATNLRVAEVHYNPTGPDADEQTAGFTDGDQFEFIELINTSAQTISLDGVELKRSVAGNALDGISFEFGLVSLDPGERIVVVSDLAAFTQRYGSGVNVAGQYTGNLANSGEVLRVTDADGNDIQQFKYDDDAAANWPTPPDGDGPSLVVINTSGDYDDGNNWAASTTTHGTPGQAEAATLVGDINNDGYVGAPDLDQLLAYWGDSAGSSPGALAADLDNSGTVGTGDLNLVIANFGNGTLPPVPTSNEQALDAPVPSAGGEGGSGGAGTAPEGASHMTDAGDSHVSDLQDGALLLTPDGLVTSTNPTQSTLPADSTAIQSPPRLVAAVAIRPSGPSRALPDHLKPANQTTAVMSSRPFAQAQRITPAMQSMVTNQRWTDALALARPVKPDATSQRPATMTSEIRRFDAMRIRHGATDIQAHPARPAASQTKAASFSAFFT